MKMAATQWSVSLPTEHLVTEHINSYTVVIYLSMGHSMQRLMTTVLLYSSSCLLIFRQRFIGNTKITLYRNTAARFLKLYLFLGLFYDICQVLMLNTGK